MLNIVVPMAGSGSRFAQAGYRLPKPLIELHGVPMIRVVIDNIRPTRPHRFIFICQGAHDEAFALRHRLAEWAPGCAVLLLECLTEGAACTVLQASGLIDSDAPLMIANSDQFVDVAIDDYLAAFDASGQDGMIMTMPSRDPKWSFAAVGADGLVTGVVEKQPVSDHATVGIYNFLRGADFVTAAHRMIASGDRTLGEFYLAPVYNHMIAAGLRIGIHEVEAAHMHGLGTPADLEAFLSAGPGPDLLDRRA
jgi:dTDP-glucose pyrophosphorylase